MRLKPTGCGCCHVRSASRADACPALASALDRATVVGRSSHESLPPRGAVQPLGMEFRGKAGRGASGRFLKSGPIAALGLDHRPRRVKIGVMSTPPGNPVEGRPREWLAMPGGRIRQVVSVPAESSPAPASAREASSADGSSPAADRSGSSVGGASPGGRGSAAGASPAACRSGSSVSGASPAGAGSASGASPARGGSASGASPAGLSSAGEASPAGRGSAPGASPARGRSAARASSMAGSSPAELVSPAVWLARLAPICPCGKPCLGSGRTCGAAECVRRLREQEVGS